MSRTRTRRARHLAAALAVVGAVVGSTLVAVPASADTGRFEDDLGDAYSTVGDPTAENPETDIDRIELRLDGSTVQVRAYVLAPNPAYLDQTTMLAWIETDDASGTPYRMTMFGPYTDSWTGPHGDPALERWTEQPGGGSAWEVVAGCPVTAVHTPAAASYTLSVAASCLGSPEAARTMVTVFTDYGGRVAQDWAPVDNTEYSPWVEAGASAPNVPAATVYRFWSPRFDNAHFFTTSVDEASAIIDHDTNWVFEGAAFDAFVADGSSCAAGTSAVHRFYSARFQSHFFTIDAAEKAQIVAHDRNWAYEGVAYCASTTQQPETTPLYRFWSPRYGKHHFTIDPDEAEQLDVGDPAWDAEGIAYYVPSF